MFGKKQVYQELSFNKSFRLVGELLLWCVVSIAVLLPEHASQSMI